MTQQQFCILGGTGFVGRHLVSLLAARNLPVTVLTRRRERHRELLVLPTVKVVETDIHDPQALSRAFADTDVVINLAGILNERDNPGQHFADVHVELPRKIVAACRAAGVKRLLHMSALNADAEKGSSAYLRSRGEGENIMHAATDLQVTSFRPSVIFGHDDSFFNRFARLLRWSPLFFPLACPTARFAPIYVRDVGRCYLWALDHKESIGRRYDLCGPRGYTLLELVRYIAQLTGYRGHILPLSDRLSKYQAQVMQHLPGKPFSVDNYLSTKMDSTCTVTLEEQFGFKAATVEAAVPKYLGIRHPPRAYDRYRRDAARD
jgi:NADH dehydrogenase